MTAKSKLHWQYLQTINDDILLTYKVQGGKSHEIFKICMAWLPCKFKKKSSTSDYHNSAVECYLAISPDIQCSSASAFTSNRYIKF